MVRILCRFASLNIVFGVFFSFYLLPFDQTSYPFTMKQTNAIILYFSPSILVRTYAQPTLISRSEYWHMSAVFKIQVGSILFSFCWEYLLRLYILFLVFTIFISRESTLSLSLSLSLSLTLFVIRLHQSVFFDHANITNLRLWEEWE